MVNTLERDGTERQFLILANALAGGPFEVELGCQQETITIPDYA